MLEFLKEYIGTIIVGTMLLGIVTAVIIRLIKRKKAGKCIACDACDGKCSACPSRQNNNEILNKQA